MGIQLLIWKSKEGIIALAINLTEWISLQIGLKTKNILDIISHLNIEVSMASFTSSVSSTHTYHGSSEVSFFLNDRDGLAVTIDTARLHIRSVEASEEDCRSYVGLFGDPDVMSKYATGLPSRKETIETRIKNVWAKRWQEHDPYSGLAVFIKDTEEFVGHVIIGHGDVSGQSELAYLFMQNHWHKGFGTEAVTSVVTEYAPATVQEGYTLADSPLEEGAILETITATTRPDNLASVKILEKLGMYKISEDEKYGTVRHQYSIHLSELSKKA